VGSGDLYPPGLPSGFEPPGVGGGGQGGFGSPEGGSYVGPNHPLFAPRGPGWGGGPDFGPGPGPRFGPGAHPPRPRFDPFGPVPGPHGPNFGPGPRHPGVRGGWRGGRGGRGGPGANPHYFGPSGEPNPDHLRPPSEDDGFI
jgi:hypothetical protein